MRESPAKANRVFHKNRFVFLLLLAVIIINAAFHRPFSQPVEHDYATYYYYAQELGKGKLFYRDVWDMKTPLTYYLTSLVYRAHRLFPEIDYISSVRLLFIGILYLSALVIFFLVREWTGDRWTALCAALIFASLTDQMWYACMGPSPKTVMNLMGLFSLWFLFKQRLGAAGFMAALAFLNWQPGIVFAIPAALHIFQRRKSTKASKAAIQYLVWFFFPVALFLGYFAFEGALSDLYKAVFVFSGYRVAGQFHPLKTLNLIHEVVAALGEKHFFYLTFAFVLVYPAFRGLYKFIKNRGDREVMGNIDLLYVLTLGTALYSIINFGWVLDTIPFTPLVSIWIALSAGLVLRFPVKEGFKKIFKAAVILTISFYSLFNCWNHSLARTVIEGNKPFMTGLTSPPHNENRLLDPRKAGFHIVSFHGKENVVKTVKFDRDYQENYIRRQVNSSSPAIFALEAAEYLLLWELSNPIPFALFHTELEAFVNDHYPGGWEKIYRMIKEADPEFMIIHPWEDPPTLKRLYRFLRENNYRVKSWQHKKRSVHTYQEFLYVKAGNS